MKTFEKNQKVYKIVSQRVEEMVIVSDSADSQNNALVEYLDDIHLNRYGYENKDDLYSRKSSAYADLLAIRKQELADVQMEYRIAKRRYSDCKETYSDILKQENKGE